MTFMGSMGEVPCFFRTRFLARVFLLAFSCWLPEIVFALVHEFLFTCLSTCANVYPYLFVGKTLHYRVYDAGYMMRALCTRCTNRK